MDGLYLESSGNFNDLERFLSNIKKSNYRKLLEECGRRGVEALSSATPTNTGKTASMWGYEIHKTRSGYELVWTNSNVNKGVNIAVILQYGHGTRNGGYVQGRNYIDPSIQPVFDNMVNDLGKAMNTNG